MVAPLSLPWTERFRPRTYDDLVVDGNRGALEELRAWMLDWRNGILRGQIPAARVAFLYGPPGIGKTASVEALARDLGFDLFELNASDKRTAENIRRYVGRGLASAWTPSGKMRMILIDEVDGIHSQNDRGGLGVLRDMILRSRVPVVLVANDAFQRRLRPLMAI
ncbi:TPA: AAA family ATPase, partial [Candidatus Bathyarchaeota archaeon]|nr:AAA family ATPase [Candidatus Bathyarchaeota archaeon]